MQKPPHFWGGFCYTWINMSNNSQFTGGKTTNYSRKGLGYSIIGGAITLASLPATIIGIGGIGVVFGLLFCAVGVLSCILGLAKETAKKPAWAGIIISVAVAIVTVVFMGAIIKAFKS